METRGSVENGFEGVRETFERCLEEFRIRGGAVSVIDSSGRSLVELQGGEGRAGRPWAENTLANTYSVTKAMAAISTLICVERGLLSLDDRVADHWPEFAQAGKDSIPVRWLLTHQAGLPAIRGRLENEVLYDWGAVIRLLEAEPPWWTPGTKHGEHAIFYGHLLGELVRRVSRKSIGEYFNSNVAQPLEMDFYIGLDDKEIGQVADLDGFTQEYRSLFLSDSASLLMQALGNPPALFEPSVVNSEAWRRSEIPAVNGHGSARAIATFYACLANGGQLGNVRVLREDLVQLACKPQARGIDQVTQTKRDFGLGLQVFSSDTFGMRGLGGFYGFANTSHGIGLGYVCGTMTSFDPPHEIIRALSQALGSPLLPE